MNRVFESQSTNLGECRIHIKDHTYTLNGDRHMIITCSFADLLSIIPLAVIVAGENVTEDFKGIMKDYISHRGHRMCPPDDALAKKMHKFVCPSRSPDEIVDCADKSSSGDVVSSVERSSSTFVRNGNISSEFSLIEHGVPRAAHRWTAEPRHATECRQDLRQAAMAEQAPDGAPQERKVKPRWLIPRAAKQVLEEVYRVERFPSAEMRSCLALCRDLAFVRPHQLCSQNSVCRCRRLAIDFDVTPRQIQFWFQNRRQHDQAAKQGQCAQSPEASASLSASSLTSAPAAQSIGTSTAAATSWAGAPRPYVNMPCMCSSSAGGAGWPATSGGVVQHPIPTYVRVVPCMGAQPQILYDEQLGTNRPVQLEHMMPAAGFQPVMPQQMRQFQPIQPPAVQPYHALYPPILRPAAPPLGQPGMPAAEYRPEAMQYFCVPPSAPAVNQGAASPAPAAMLSVQYLQHVQNALGAARESSQRGEFQASCSSLTSHILVLATSV
eukprot:3461255-Pleurochrysis_carterae.AAC.2